VARERYANERGDFLLAPQRKNINTLRIHGSANPFGNLIDRTLKGEIFIQCEISRYLLFMCDRRYERVSIQGWIFIKEGNKFIILINDMVAIEAARYQLTNKTRAILNMVDVGIQIKGSATIHGLLLFRARQCGRDSQTDIHQACKIALSFLEILVSLQLSRQ